MKAKEQFSQDCNGLAQLMRKRLGVRTVGVPQTFAAAKTQLPKAHRIEVERILDALRMAEHPKLALILDYQGLRRAARVLEKQLSGMKSRSVRMDAFVAWAASLLLNLMVVIALVFAVLRWRGLV